MKSRMYARSMLALAVMSAAGIPQTAGAQEMVLEEVIVTAQKREETSQDVPISIATLSETAIEQRNLVNVADLIGEIPGVGGFSAPGSRGASGLSIRGVSGGSPGNLSLDPAVAMYLDGVYIGKLVGSAVDVAELARIEVLRGPQGTLYGRNATGGAINFVTKRPSGELGAKITGSFGNYDYQSLKASVDLPALGTIGEGLGQLAANVGYQIRKRDGFYDNLTPGADDFNDLDREAWRVALAWDLSDSLSIDYAYDHSELDEINNLQQTVGFTPLDSAGNSRIDGLYSALDAARAFGGLPGVDPRVNSRLVPSIEQTIDAYEEVLARGDGPHDTRSEFLPTSKDDVDGHALTVTWDAGDLGALGEVEFKSISAWRELDTKVFGDLEDIDTSLDSNGVGAMNDVLLNNVPPAFYFLLWDEIDAGPGAFHSKQDTRTRYEQFSQELQMVGTTDRLEYALGLYYFEDEGKYDRYALFLNPIGGNGAQLYKNETDAWAVFGQTTWRPGWMDDRLAITFGLRYTEEEKSIDYNYTESTQLFRSYPAVSSSLDDDFDNISGNLTLAYDLTDSAQVFLRYATGYRSGGFNGEQFENAYDEETIDQLELGIKSELWDRRLRLNASIYTYEWDDLQVSQIVTQGGTASTLITNAGKAERWGGEIEMLVLPIEDLILGLSYSYIHGDFEEFPDVCGTNEPVVCLRGEKFAKRGGSPDNQISASADYTIARTDLGEWRAYVSVNWRDDWVESALWQAVVNGDPVIYDHIGMDDRTLVNARLSLEEIAVGDGRLRVALWGNNLLDEEYQTFGINFGTLGLITEQYGDPMTYGIDVIYEY